MRSMLPQSRKTIVRSATSSGGAPTRPSKVKPRYSHGSGNSSGDMYISESLPSCSRMPVHGEQRAERVAVRVLVRREQELVGVAQLLRAPAPARWRRAHPRRSSSSVIRMPRSIDSSNTNSQGGRALHAQLAARPPLEHAMGGLETRQRLGALVLVAEHAHVHAGVAQVWAGFNGGHGHESYAGVSEALGDPRRDDLTDRLVDPAHAVGHPTLRQVLERTSCGFPHLRPQETSNRRSGRGSALCAQLAGVTADERGRQRGALPEIVVVGLGHGRAEAPLQLGLQRADSSLRLPLRLAVSGKVKAGSRSGRRSSD